MSRRDRRVRRAALRRRGDELVGLAGAGRPKSRRGRPGATAGGSTPSAPARGEAICRTENVSACHPGFAALAGGPLADRGGARRSGSRWSASRTRSTTSSPGGRGSAPIRTWPPIPGPPGWCRSCVAIDECSDGVGVRVVRVRRRRAPAHRRPGRGAPRRGGRPCRGPGRAGTRATPCASTGSTPHYSEANTQRRRRAGSWWRATRLAGDGYGREQLLRGPGASRWSGRRARDAAVPHQHAGRLRRGGGPPPTGAGAAQGCWHA